MKNLLVILQFNLDQGIIKRKRGRPKLGKSNLNISNLTQFKSPLQISKIFIILI